MISSRSRENGQWGCFLGYLSLAGDIRQLLGQTFCTGINTSLLLLLLQAREGAHQVVCLQTAEVMVVCRHQDYRLGPFPISLVVDVLVHAHSNPHHSPRVHSLHWIALHFVSVSLVGLELCNKNWDDTIHLTLVLLPLLEWPVSLCMVPLSWVGYSFAWTPLHTPSLQAEPGHILYVHLWVA